MAKRRFAFFSRAQNHDLKCVKESFLFDLTHLYPHQDSWTAQTVAILRTLGVHVDERRLNIHDCLEKVTAATRDVELLCFRHVKTADDKTLSFFRIFPDPATARDFRTFLSSLEADVQDLLVIFLSSGMRWRFFSTASRGVCCPLCSFSFWSWEHFLQCPRTNQRVTLYLEFLAAATEGNWMGIAEGVRDVLKTWIGLFSHDAIEWDEGQIDALFSFVT
jgi:hypothetical protein